MDIMKNKKHLGNQLSPKKNQQRFRYKENHIPQKAIYCIQMVNHQTL